MPALSPQHHEILLALFRAAKGEAEVFVLLEESPLLEELLHAKLLKLEIEEANGGEAWYGALTGKGQALAAELHQQQSTVYVKIPFDGTQSEHVAILEYLSNIADTAEKKANLLADLFALHEALERGDIDALLNAYPESRATFQQMIRASVDSQMMAQEQHRINHLLGEISELKAMLTKQAEHQRPTIAPKVEEDDDAPIPAPKAVALRPVLPHTPQGQPKQLTVPQFALPKDDEDSEALFVVKKDEEAGKRASENFIQSLGRLQKS